MAARRQVPGRLRAANVAALARQSRGADPLGLQAEFANLVELAASLGTPAAR